MIKTFKCKETLRIFNKKYSKIIPSELHKIALRKLLIIDAAIDLNDLKIPPGNKLEALRGNRKGQYSIRINDQYRICFKWLEGYAIDLEILDYHKG